MQASIDTGSQLMLNLSFQIDKHGEQAGKRDIETGLTIQKLDDNLSKLHNDTEIWNKNTQNQQTVRWLSAPDPSCNYYAAREKHQPSTGEWLTTSRDLSDWKANPSSLLWLHGIRKLALEHLSLWVLS